MNTAEIAYFGFVHLESTAEVVYGEWYLESITALYALQYSWIKLFRTYSLTVI